MIRLDEKAYRATLQIGFPAAGDLFAKLPVGG